MNRTNTATYAERELNILCKTDKDPIIAPFRKEIIALCEKFGRSGQSGGSAPYTAAALAQAIKNLCLQEPICDITGIDEEWMDVSDKIPEGDIYQNIRCGSIFKVGKEGKPYYLDAIAWKTESGATWGGAAYLSDGTKVYSRNYIKAFPFKPKTFVIDVIEKEIAKDDWEFYVKDEAQLQKAFEYYQQFTK